MSPKTHRNPGPASDARLRAMAKQIVRVAEELAVPCEGGVIVREDAEARERLVELVESAGKRLLKRDVDRLQAMLDRLTGWED